MIPKSSPRSVFANNLYAATAPFTHLIEITSRDRNRPGVRLPESTALGGLQIFPPCEAKMEAELPYAYYEMLERAPRLVVRTVGIARWSVFRNIHLVVAEDEAEEKVAAFKHWGDASTTPADQLARNYQFWEEFLAGTSGRILGWWALGYQVAWALTLENAERIKREAFQQLASIEAQAD